MPLSLPQIRDYRDLARMADVEPHALLRMSTSPARYYRCFSIPKRSGQRRTISEPLPQLKRVQRFLLSALLKRLPCPPCAMAFRPGVSLRENALCHLGQPWILKVDLRDYFDTLREPRVFALYQSLGYSGPVSTLLTKLCVLNHRLPQGAPTSPCLSNLLTRDLDGRLNALCAQRALHYTRYADDITISGAFQVRELLPQVLSAVKECGLLVNYEKIAVLGRHELQSVTGVAVNEKLQVPRRDRRRLRLELFCIQKYGLPAHLRYHGLSPLEGFAYCEHLLGRVGFCLQINPWDREMQAYREYLTGLLKECMALQG